MSDAVWIMSGVTFAAAEAAAGAACEVVEWRQASETSTEARAAFFMGGGPLWGRRQALRAAVRHDGNGWRGSGGERRRHVGHDVFATYVTPQVIHHPVHHREYHQEQGDIEWNDQHEHQPYANELAKEGEQNDRKHEGDDHDDPGNGGDQCKHEQWQHVLQCADRAIADDAEHAALAQRDLAQADRIET